MQSKSEHLSNPALGWKQRKSDREQKWGETYKIVSSQTGGGNQIPKRQLPGFAALERQVAGGNPKQYLKRCPYGHSSVEYEQDQTEGYCSNCHRWIEPFQWRGVCWRCRPHWYICQACCTIQDYKRNWWEAHSGASSSSSRASHFQRRS